MHRRQCLSPLEKKLSVFLFGESGGERNQIRSGEEKRPSEHPSSSSVYQHQWTTGSCLLPPSLSHLKGWRGRGEKASLLRGQFALLRNNGRNFPHNTTWKRNCLFSPLSPSFPLPSWPPSLHHPTICVFGTISSSSLFPHLDFQHDF